MAETHTPEPVPVPDPDFTPEEHAEFAKLEAEHPYQEIKEETIRIPKRPERITDTRNDTLFLIVFCAAIAAVLAVILIFAALGIEP